MIAVIKEYLGAEDRPVRPKGGFTPQVSLAIRAKVKPDTLSQLLSSLENNRESMDFDIADRLLCAMGLQHLWWTRLRETYLEVNLSSRGTVAEWIAEFETKVCPTCKEEFMTITNLSRGYGSNKYCSQECVGSANMAIRYEVAV